MYAPHNTESPYGGLSRYVSPYGFPLPSLGALDGLSTGEIAIGAVALAGLWWFLKGRHHRR